MFKQKFGVLRQAHDTLIILICKKSAIYDITKITKITSILTTNCSMNSEKKENFSVFKLNFGHVVLLCKNENFKFLNIESFPFFFHSEVHFCSIFLNTEKFSFFSYS